MDESATQEIVFISKIYFDELEVGIQKEIDERSDYMEIQQINYFNMETDSDRCEAFILFRPKQNT